MGYKDILVITKKENRDYLVFIILLLIASILIQFERYSFLWWRGAELLNFATETIFLIFIFSLILRDKMKKYSYFIIPLCFVLWYPYSFFLTQTVIGDWIWYILFFTTLFYWLFMTAGFSMNDVYLSSVKWDEKIVEGAKSSKHVLRWILFIGGTVISILGIYFGTLFVLNFQHHELGYKSMYLTLNFFMILYIVFFFIIGIISLFFRKSYFWFGMYFLFVTVYALKLMIDLGRYEFQLGGGIKALEILSYGLNIYLLLTTFGDLMGPSSDVIASKLKIIKPRTLSLWLIYSFAGTMGEAENIGAFQLMFLIYAFPFFVGVFGFGAIYAYNKRSNLEKGPKEIVSGSKEKSKEEKSKSKIKDKLKKQMEFIDYLINKNKLKTALSNANKLKKEAEKHEFFDLFNEANQKIDFCTENLSK